MKAKTPKPKVKFQITLIYYENGMFMQNIKGSRTAAEVIGVTEIFKNEYMNDVKTPKP
jgi:hypothetical protein